MVPCRQPVLQRSSDEPWGDTYTTLPDKKDTAMEKVSCRDNEEGLGFHSRGQTDSQSVANEQDVPVEEEMHAGLSTISLQAFAPKASSYSQPHYDR